MNGFDQHLFTFASFKVLLRKMINIGLKMLRWFCVEYGGPVLGEGSRLVQPRDPGGRSRPGTATA